MHRVQLQLRRCLLNQHRSRSDLAREAKHLLVEGGREEQNLDGEVESAEHLRHADNILGEGRVVQHLVRLVDHQADQVRVVEGLVHQRGAKRSDRCNHHLSVRVVVVAFHEVGGGDGGVFACGREELTPLQR